CGRGCITRYNLGKTEHRRAGAPPPAPTKNPNGAAPAPPGPPFFPGGFWGGGRCPGPPCPPRAGGGSPPAPPPHPPPLSPPANLAGQLALWPTGQRRPTPSPANLRAIHFYLECGRCRAACVRIALTPRRRPCLRREEGGRMRVVGKVRPPGGSRMRTALRSLA